MNGRVLAAWFLACSLATLPGAARSEEPGETPATVLEGIRADLLEARLDQAMVRLDALLARDDLSEQERVDSLALRAQARGATGAFDGAEEDYRAILVLHPGFEPDPSSTSKKAMQRFEKARDSLVGTLEFALDPPDAAVTVDGKPLRPGPDGRVRVRAGARAVRIERKGFDPAELAVDVPAGGSAPVRADLVPNARAVLIRTEQEDVEVRIDDVLVGRTARLDDPDPVIRATRPAELMLEAVPAGEHVVTLARPCFRSVRLREVVVVDMLDRTPKIVGPVVLQAARTVLELRNGPATGEIRVDGERLADLPSETPPEVCAGPRRIAIHSGGRSVWSATVEVPVGERLPLDVAPRPNAVLVGAARWPSDLATLRAEWSTVATLDVPEGADLRTRQGWSRVELPVDADLAVAVVSHGGAGASDRWVLYSPLLGRATPFSVAPDPGRPRWRRPATGFRVVDAPEGGVRIVERTSEEPGSATPPVVGDRVIRLGDRPVAGLADWREATSSLPDGESWSLEVVDSNGALRRVSVRPSESVRAGLPPDEPLRGAIHAAWSAAVGAGGGRDAAPAWTDLGVLLEREGRYAGALDALRRASWPNRPGIGAGTVDYLVGRVLEAMGRDEEARQAFRRATEGAARIFDDDGPEVGPAARDHLADLGVAP